MVTNELTTRERFLVKTIELLLEDLKDADKFTCQIVWPALGSAVDLAESVLEWDPVAYNYPGAQYLVKRAQAVLKWKDNFLNGSLS